MSDKLGRRGFMGGALGASATAGLGSGCARDARPTELDPDDVALWMRRLERSAEAIDQSPVLVELSPPPRNGQALAEWEAADRQIRGYLRSLYVSGAYLDLPEEGRRHPEIQEWMRGELPAIEARGELLLERLERSTAEERRAVREELRRDPELMSRFATVVDERARIGGLRPERRRQTREIFRMADWRLRAQPPSLIIDEYTAKARRVQAWRGIAGPQDGPVESGAALGPVPSPPAPGVDGAGGEGPPTANGAPTLDREAYEQQLEERERVLREQIAALREGGERRLRAGGWMLGVGVVAGSVGGAMIAGSNDLDGLFFVGNVLVTHGVVLFVLGLIFALVGASRKRRAEREARLGGA
jgi:hypothetical protein